MECNIILIDNQSDITLIKELLPSVTAPIKVTFAPSISEAFNSNRHYSPDLILISSSIIIKEAFDVFNKLRSIPVMVMMTTDGLQRILTDVPPNTCFVERPWDLDRFSTEILERAYSFWLSLVDGI